jgi:hypothetical protein
MSDDIQVKLMKEMSNMKESVAPIRQSTVDSVPMIIRFTWSKNMLEYKRMKYTWVMKAPVTIIHN